ncbi:protease inhibitor I42 family protein [Pelodictyon luteolum]|uniref:Proteinase inhibitor I42 chagasin domain-containing protein n=1 Tax=Chlorobium luteolum (strain DSM 273 / BCRC 81028 / 2530) TaxID=319225 RepID=Q3B441_CHLL3|nr:protease inhibitor I42 family protein [Pelodictyon luteolum]ABB23890.1 hypothetical protein Plut_1028 [Pelodictyon luteolum DSM 273]
MKIEKLFATVALTGMVLFQPQSSVYSWPSIPHPKPPVPIPHPPIPNPPVPVPVPKPPVNPAEQIRHATEAATKTMNKAASGDFDGVADDCIGAASNPAPFRDVALKALVRATPSQLRGVSEKATSIYKNLDDQYGQIKADTYRSLYESYKGDFKEIAARIEKGDYDISEYRKYALAYGLATADWSNPAAAVEKIASNQYAVYSWYSKHTIRGAAISATRNHFGADDAAVEGGIRQLAQNLKEANAGVAGGAIMAEFVKNLRIITVTVKPQEETLIELPANPSTGYSWSFVSLDPGVVTFNVLDKSAVATGIAKNTWMPFKPPIHPVKPVVVGKADAVHIKIRANKAGSGRILGLYSRPWDKETGELTEIRVISDNR